MKLVRISETELLLPYQSATADIKTERSL